MLACDWSSDVCSSDLPEQLIILELAVIDRKRPGIIAFDRIGSHLRIGKLPDHIFVLIDVLEDAKPDMQMETLFGESFLHLVDQKLVILSALGVDQKSIGDPPTQDRTKLILEFLQVAGDRA